MWRSSLISSANQQRCTTRIARRCSHVRCTANKQPRATADLNPEDLVGAAWDPEGVLPPPTSSSSGGHFARRERERAAKLQAQQTMAGTSAAAQLVQSSPAVALTMRTPALQPIPTEHLATGGIRAADKHLYDYDKLRRRLTEQYMPVDLDFPGVRILHLDPVVLTVESFWSPEQCKAFIHDVEQSGQLQASKVGAGNVYDSTISAINSRRTSTSMLLDTAMETANPSLAEGVRRLRMPAWELLCANGGSSWGRPGKLPAPRQYCYESLQVARYESGQYFLSHEDAFPARQAASNMFQRHATLLLYLNDVPQGGATRFDHLGISVQPKQGMALLFFPAFSNGEPDPRTLHTAMDAQDTKWIVQQWIARGYAPQLSAVPTIAAAVTGALPVQVKVAPTTGSSTGNSTPKIDKDSLLFNPKAKKPKPSKKKGFGGS